MRITNAVIQNFRIAAQGSELKVVNPKGHDINPNFCEYNEPEGHPSYSLNHCKPCHHH